MTPYFIEIFTISTCLFL